MKNILTILFILFYSLSWAQRATVPSNSKIGLDSAKKYINNYQKKFHPGSAAHMSCYYLLNVTGIKTYICNMTSGNRYLHVYIGRQADSTYVLGFVAADIDYNIDSFVNYYDSQVWGTGLVEPSCCNIYDSNIDGPASSGGCTFGANCNSNIYYVNGSYNDIHQCLLNYQKPSTQLRAFLTNADDLADFLTNNSNVVYLEAYMGIDGSAKPKIILVGVDGNGNHVYYNTGGASYVLDESIPCPQCVTKDNLIDVYQAYPYIKKK